MSDLPWYKLQDEGEIDSPALIIFKDRVSRNIETLLNSVDDVSRLRPHIKTHKSAEVCRMLIDKGITKFKCATIAEAEVLAQVGAKDILLAYQPVGPKANRLLELMQAYPGSRLAALIDNADTANRLSELFAVPERILEYFIDVNVGMNRTGILPEEVPDLFENIKGLPGLRLRGLHMYDGHIRDRNYAQRTERCDKAFHPVEKLLALLGEQTADPLAIVAGGTPTFSVHSKRKEIECSPGTFVYWDKGYEAILPEQTYLHAAVVLSRVISKPTGDTLCIDLGHKSIASENPLDQRVFFLNAPELQPVGHSEEHMVLKNTGNARYEVGDVVYGIPYHVCPTIALYERALVAEGNKITDTWITLSRNRKITI